MKKLFLLHIAATLAASFISFGSAVQAAEFKVGSPDGNVVIAVTDAGGLSYSIFLDGRKVVDKSRFGIVADDVDLGADVTLKETSSRTIDESYPMFGGHARALNHCRETILSVHTGAGEDYALDVRAYNDGAALRSRLPAKAGRKINGEATEWKLSGNPVAWFQPDFKSYEGIFQNSRLENFLAGEKVPLPITFVLRDGGYALATEANLLNYSDLGVQVGDDHSLRAYFHASPGGWTTGDAVVQPWRVTLLARGLNALVNSDLIRNLCPPPLPEFVKADWIQPGRALWPWWSTEAPIYPEQHQWVDWTKDLGFEYYLIDDGWRKWKADGKDAWACMSEVCDFAKTRGVKIWAWVDSQYVTTAAQRSAYFDKAAAAGVVGLKIDFIPRANVQWANWYEETRRDAAARKLLVDFHGANKPTGCDRTWPNELTRESIRGLEHHRVRSSRDMLPPQHDCILPFTRFIVGPGDYTPTLFDPKELRGYTWAHELAQAIVFTSPFLCYADHATNYLSNPALDVLKAIPSTWDETVVLPGSEIGKCAAFARRNGKTWFIGVLNSMDSTSLDLPLHFLESGEYQMIQLGDSADRDDAWQREEKIVKRGDHVRLSLRRGGGCVIELQIR